MSNVKITVRTGVSHELIADPKVMEQWCQSDLKRSCEQLGLKLLVFLGISDVRESDMTVEVSGVAEKPVDRYRDFVIQFNPPPIGWRSMDWQWTHVDYDGAPVDSESNNCPDRRFGCSPSLEAAKEEIDEWYAEQESDERARMEREIKMTDDPHYRDWWNKRQKQLDIDKYGVKGE